MHGQNNIKSFLSSTTSATTPQFSSFPHLYVPVRFIYASFTCYACIKLFCCVFCVLSKWKPVGAFFVKYTSTIAGK